MTMKKILFLSKGSAAPSTRYRALQYFAMFEKQGIVPCHHTLAGGVANYLSAMRVAGTVDIVVVLRKTLPWPLLRVFRQVSRKLVFDFDDAIFCNTDGSSSATRMRRFAAMASSCDHLFAGNKFLAQRALDFNPAVTVVPTCVDAARYSADFEKPDGFIDLVWIGSSSTRKYLVEALPALRLAAARVPSLRLKIIADFDLPDAGLPTLAIQWSAETEARELGSSHIGIAPMRDNDWSRGKCALKVLQYMAASLPVVSSDAGTNAEVVIPGQTGYLASNNESWAEYIATLAKDAALRARFGTTGRQRVQRDYSIEPVFSRISGVLKGLA